MRLSAIALAAAAIFGLVSIANATDVTGTIKSMDPSAKTITLDNGDTFKLEPSVKTTELKDGQKVKVTYSGTGKEMMASSVEVVR